MSDTLQLFTLGGLAEFGKNLMVLAQGKDAIILDCGAQFSDGRNPGLEIIIPDFDPLMNGDFIIHGIVLTHGHEDHIGSVPYFLNRKNVPVYGGRFTHALVKKKCKERFPRLALDFHFIGDTEEFDVGPFHITTVAMAHSIPEALGLFVDTKMGTHFHTGDFKIDPAPADGRKTDLERIEKIASSKNMLLLTSDSTNVLVPGDSIAETSIQEGLQQAFDLTKGLLVVTSFASHIPRIFQLCQLAHKNKRKVMLLGRSVVDNVELAKTLGHMKVPEDVFIHEKEAQSLDRSELMIISTGTQGEMRAALSKLVSDQIKGFHLQEGDRVVFSSRAIPGNERSINNLINQIYRKNAQVWTWENARIHASGHGYENDLRTMIQTVKPKYFLPVHGELRMLKRHQELAIESGIPKENTFYIENGDVLEFSDTGVKAKKRFELFPKIIDEGVLIDLAAQYLKDRKKLSAQGSLAVVITINPDTFEMLHDPILEEFGFIPEDKKEALFKDIGRAIEKEMHRLAKKPFHGDLNQQLKMWVSRTARTHLNRKPVILPIIIEA